MHILLIHQAFASLSEPGGTRHHELALHLAAKGHRVTVLAGQVSYLTGCRTSGCGWVVREHDPRGVDIWRCYTYPAWHRSFVHRVFSFLSFMLSSFLVGLRVRDVNLVWGTSPPIFQGVTAYVLARMKGAAFLFEVRDLWPMFAIAVGVLHNPVLIRLSEWLERWLYRTADAVVVNSPGFTEHVRARGARTIHLIPNGVDSQMFDPHDHGRDFRKLHNLERKFLVMYAGAHGMSNDLEVVLEAAVQLKGHDEVMFVLIGDGKEKANLQLKAEGLGLRNTLFLPPMPKKDIPAALAAADACVVILKPVEAYKTTYPNKAFDYMAAGRPVILAVDGVMRNEVERARAGIFVRPGDAAAMAEAICWLKDHREEGRQMGMAGRAHVENNFDRKDLAEKLERAMAMTVEDRSTKGGHQMGQPAGRSASD